MKYQEKKLGRPRAGVLSPAQGAVMPSKFQGYCATCHYTIWRNETIRFDGRATHLDCRWARKDGTPRRLDKRKLTPKTRTQDSARGSL